jgi:hypothetical protein
VKQALIKQWAKDKAYRKHCHQYNRPSNEPEPSNLFFSLQLCDFHCVFISEILLELGLVIREHQQKAIHQPNNIACPAAKIVRFVKSLTETWLTKKHTQGVSIHPDKLQAQQVYQITVLAFGVSTSVR